MEWYSPNEKVPEENIDVLIFRDGDMRVSAYYGLFYDGTQNWGYTGLGGDPQYWAYLPEGPKEGL